MAKQPVKKTPPAKKVEFTPQFVVEYKDANPVKKFQLFNEDELQKFHEENSNPDASPEIFQFITKDEFDKIEIVDVKPTEIVLDKTPEPEIDINDLPERLNVENKKTGNQFVVNRKYYLANRGELKIV